MRGMHVTKCHLILFARKIESEKLKAGVTSPMQQKDGRCTRWFTCYITILIDSIDQNSEQLYQKEVAKLITDIRCVHFHCANVSLLLSWWAVKSRQAHCHKNNTLDGLETQKSIKDQSELEDIGMSENDFEDLKRRVRMQEASRRYRKRKKVCILSKWTIHSSTSD